MRSTLLSLGLLIAAAAAAAEPLYFESPEAAVTKTTELLKAKDWPTLASYYDLSDSRLDRRELESGAYFFDPKPEALVHPGLPPGYKRPFVPGFKFDRAEPAIEPDVVRVTLSLNVDQAAGATQRGVDEFYLKKSDKGFRILAGYKENRLDWKDYDGTGDAAKAEFIINGELLGKGAEGVAALHKRVALMQRGERLVVVPYYGDPAAGKHYPFDLEDLKQTAEKAGVRILIPSAR